MALSRLISGRRAVGCQELQVLGHHAMPWPWDKACLRFFDIWFLFEKPQIQVVSRRAQHCSDASATTDQIEIVSRRGQHCSDASATTITIVYGRNMNTRNIAELWRGMKMGNGSTASCQELPDLWKQLYEVLPIFPYSLVGQ